MEAEALDLAQSIQNLKKNKKIYLSSKYEKFLNLGSFSK